MGRRNRSCLPVLDSYTSQNPYKQIYVAGSGEFSPSSYLCSSQKYLADVKEKLQMYCVLKCTRSGVNQMYILKGYYTTVSEFGIIKLFIKSIT